MKISILIEGSPKSGGGFFHSLNSLISISEIKIDYFNFEIIITDPEAEKYLKKYFSKIRLYKRNFIIEYYSELFEIEILKNFFEKFKLSHPFTSFIKKNDYDFMVFLGPSNLSKYVDNLNYVINIWDLDHKLNNQYPEHRNKLTYENREKILTNIVFKSFKIIVPHKNNKQDLINFYKCDEKKIYIQHSIPYLSLIYNNNENKDLYKKKFELLEINLDKKIIFYPSQFWPHKNHKYLVDVAKKLKKKKDNRFLFVCCGTDKGSLDYILKEIKNNKLDDYFEILPFIEDDDIISLYLNCSSVVMPTFGGPTNLPLYESFFFKKIIFYSNNLIKNDPEFDQCFIGINPDKSSDLVDKLEILFDNSKIKKITDRANLFYHSVCKRENLKKIYLEIFTDFKKILERWK